MGYPCRIPAAVVELLLALLSQPSRRWGPVGLLSRVYPRGLARPSRAFAVAVEVAADWARVGLQLLRRWVDPDAWVSEARVSCRCLSSGSCERSSQPFFVALKQLLVTFVVIVAAVVSV